MSVHQQITEKLRYAEAKREQHADVTPTLYVYYDAIVDTLEWVLALIEKEYRDDA